LPKQNYNLEQMFPHVKRHVTYVT